MKKIIVINGAGGVGKDTLIGFAEERYQVMNESSIDPIKDAAKALGWDTCMKRDKDRKFLSDLKLLATEYNDCSMKHIHKKCLRFLDSSYQILFVHIRETKEIQRFVEHAQAWFSIKPITLLVRRDAVMHEYGNMADDGVEGYKYDYYFDNNGTLKDAEKAFAALLEEMA